MVQLFAALMLCASVAPRANTERRSCPTACLNSESARQVSTKLSFSRPLAGWKRLPGNLFANLRLSHTDRPRVVVASLHPKNDSQAFKSNLNLCILTFDIFSFSSIF
jgi:hypothetical protein